MNEISTEFSKMMGCRYPIIAAPMFLVSNEEITVKASEMGGIGTFPALNFRPIAEYEKTLKSIKKKTNKPIGVNIIVNKSNIRQKDDLKVALDNGVDLFITSLGNPKDVIKGAHSQGAKVFCDVTNLEHAKKVRDLGCDGIIAVGSGAGGHAGPISPFVLIPWLKKEINLPIILAGGVVDGIGLAGALALGAAGVSVGTRFIASQEATVSNDYKEAIVKASADDIIMTRKISGTPASVIRTPYFENDKIDIEWALNLLAKNKRLKKYVTPLLHLLGMKTLEASAKKASWKTVWSAGQTVGLIDDVLTVEEIFDRFVTEYTNTVNVLPKP